MLLQVAIILRAASGVSGIFHVCGVSHPVHRFDAPLAAGGAGQVSERGPAAPRVVMACTISLEVEVPAAS